MQVEENPGWDHSWQDAAVFGVYLWAEDEVRSWFRLRNCDVREALDWAEALADGNAYSLALLVSDPTERAPDRDGRIWLLGGDVLAGDESAP